MAREIERKFLVDHDRLGPLENGVAIRQGFVQTTDFTVVRVRIAGERAWLTLKGRNKGAARSEFEYPIPLGDAEQILDEFCSGHVVAKTRYLRQYGDHTWEIDVFEGDNAGLVVAEVELKNEQEVFRRPDWVGREVTYDERYYNVNLLSHPFSRWHENR